MTKTISFRLDDALYSFIKNKPNLTKYLSELIKQDVQMQQKKPITQAVKLELLQDESFFRELSERLKLPIPPVVSAPKESLLMGVHTGGGVKYEDVPLESLELPCCKQKSPCKHWSFDGVHEVWVNSLSGRTRSEEL